MMENKYEILISIDVGLSGGISFFDVGSGELLSVKEMPTKEETGKAGRTKKVLDIERLKFILEVPHLHKDKAIVVYESIHAFGNAGFGIGTIMEEKGVVRGICVALGYDEYPITPKEWQKHFSLVPPKETKSSNRKKTRAVRRKWIKDNSIYRAREIFPEWADTKLFTKTCDGLSDSLLMGKYVLDNYFGA